MAELESKASENGDVASPSVADTMKVTTGEAHQPSDETIAAAETLKAEGNELLAGEPQSPTAVYHQQERPCVSNCGVGRELGRVLCVRFCCGNRCVLRRKRERCESGFREISLDHETVFVTRPPQPSTAQQYRYDTTPVSTCSVYAYGMYSSTASSYARSKTSALVSLRAR